MYGRLQEEVAWTRVLDAQREIENRRLTGGASFPSTAALSRSFRELVTRLPQLFRRSTDRAGGLDERPTAARDVA